MIENISVPVLVAVISALGALVLGVINVMGSRGSSRADAASTITDAALQLLNEQKQRTRAIEARLDTATSRISSLEHNEQMNQQRMMAMEEQYKRDKRAFESDIEKRDKLIGELFKGIEILINQIKRHDSSPHWTPDAIDAKDE